MKGFKYWDAPETEMKALLPGVRGCDFCSLEERCFDLMQAMRPAGVAASVGCVACLQAGRFGFFHVTTLGYLDDGGLTWYGDDEPATPQRAFAVDPDGKAVATAASPVHIPPERVPPEALEGLRRTPSFPSWNEVAWPSHCKDFMVYLGPWQPRNVRGAALVRQCQPRELFLEMTEATDARLWSDDDEEWAFAFHVFRCNVCHVLRGAVDLD